MIAVYDFLDLATDDGYVVSIYDLHRSKVVFEGTLQDMMETKYYYMEVCSFDLLCNSTNPWEKPAIEINIDSSDYD